MELWSEEFVSEKAFSKYCSFDSRNGLINPKLGKKRPKLVFHVPMLIKRWKSIVKGNLTWSICFWNHYLKILKFWLLVTQLKNVSKLKFKSKSKSKIKIKGYFKVNYSFMKPVSQNFEVLSQSGYIINTKFTRNLANLAFMTS